MHRKTRRQYVIGLFVATGFGTAGGVTAGLENLPQWAVWLCALAGAGVGNMWIEQFWKLPSR